MNNTTGQSEDLGENAGIEENGSTVAADGATSDAGQENEEETEQGEQGEKQSKSANRNARRRRLQEASETEKAQLREDNRKLVERLDTLESQVDEVRNPPEPRPQRVDFESEEDYEDSLHDWRTNQKPAVAAQQSTESEQSAQTQTQETAQKPMTAEAKKVVDNWTDSCDDAADKYDDFDDITKNSKSPMTNVMQDSIIESQNGGEVFYHLAKNPAEAARIAGLSLVQQIKEIGELDKKFTSTTTSAPEPIETTAGIDDTGVAVDVENMSPEAYRDHRRKQKAARA